MILAPLAFFAICATFRADRKDRMEFLDNGQIKLGVDLDLGGAITYLSQSGSDVNVVNSADWGRQIQMSHYSGPVPFKPHGKEPATAWVGLGWNPIQVGDAFGNRSKLLSYRNDGQSLYVKCIPMQWPLNNEPGECTFECWLHLEGKAVLVRSRMVNSREDHTQYEGRGQELPAVYTNGPWYRLMTYTGDQPFTHGKLEQRPPVFMWTSWQSTENWAALVDDKNFGLGIWNPGVYSFIGGFAGTPGKGGPKDGPTGYIAPVATEIIDHNIEYDYRYVLILGQLEEIRKYVYDHAKRPKPPTYRFNHSREHWVYRGAVDSGWPIRHGLDIATTSSLADIVGPDGFWLAKDGKTVVIEAAFDSVPSRVSLGWKRADQPAFSTSKQIQLQVIPDGRVHKYTVDLREFSEYRGVITGIGLQVQTAMGSRAHLKLNAITIRN